MAKYLHFRCPDCNGVFRHLQLLSDEPPPDRCALCGSWMRDDIEPAFVPLAPGIRKSLIVKSMDQTYRAMEEASIERAKEAAEVAGVPESAMSHLKMTDMKDPSSVREGESSAITRPNQISQLMQQHSEMGGGFNPLNIGGSAVPGQMLAATAHQDGIYPHAGEAVRAATQQSHRERAWQMQMRGQMGSYSGKG